MIIKKIVVEAAGVELFTIWITRNLLIPGTATTAKKAPLPDVFTHFTVKKRRQVLFFFELSA